MKQKSNGLPLLSILFPITLIGTFLRLHNLSPFKIYPDSYLQLVMTGNIRMFGDVIGWLGEKGMLYPDFIAWTRPFFPLVLTLITSFVSDVTFAGQTLSFTSGILAVPVIYLFLKKLFTSPLIGICGALLLSLSFNHIVWGGFILTETLGVLMMLFFLLSVVILQKDQSHKIIIDITAGILLALAILTRYEYSLVIIPTILLLGKKNLMRSLTLLAVTALTLGVTGILLFPLPFLFATVFSQFQDHFFILGSGIGILLILFLIYKRTEHFFAYEKISKGILFAFLGTVMLLSFHLLVYPIFSFMGIEVSGMLDFFSSEPLLAITFITGVIMMLRYKKYTSVLLFTTLCILLLELAYYRANPYAQRYWTHLLPFLLIPGSYGLASLLSSRPSIVIPASNPVIPVRRYEVASPLVGKAGIQKLFIWGGIVILILTQTFMSYQGIRDWQDGAWRRTSYEEKAGKIVASKTPDKSALLLVSFPESYYYLTQLSTHSLTDTPPFIYIHNSLDKESLIIVQDMGMRDLFPTFSRFLDTKMQDRKIDSFRINEPYHYADRTLKETYPITLYRTTVRELKSRLKSIQ